MDSSILVLSFSSLILVASSVPSDLTRTSTYTEKAGLILEPHFVRYSHQQFNIYPQALESFLSFHSSLTREYRSSADVRADSFELVRFLKSEEPLQTMCEFVSNNCKKVDEGFNQVHTITQSRHRRFIDPGAWIAISLLTFGLATLTYKTALNSFELKNLKTIVAAQGRTIQNLVISVNDGIDNQENLEALVMDLTLNQNFLRKDLIHLKTEVYERLIIHNSTLTQRIIISSLHLLMNQLRSEIQMMKDLIINVDNRDIVLNILTDFKVQLGSDQYLTGVTIFSGNFPVIRVNLRIAEIRGSFTPILRVHSAPVPTNHTMIYSMLPSIDYVNGNRSLLIVPDITRCIRYPHKEWHICSLNHYATPTPCELNLIHGFISMCSNRFKATIVGCEVVHWGEGFVIISGSCTVIVGSGKNAHTYLLSGSIIISRITAKIVMGGVIIYEYDSTNHSSVISYSTNANTYIDRPIDTGEISFDHIVTKRLDENIEFIKRYRVKDYSPIDYDPGVFQRWESYIVIANSVLLGLILIKYVLDRRNGNNGPRTEVLISTKHDENT